jgi:hypothetical protein
MVFSAAAVLLNRSNWQYNVMSPALHFSDSTIGDADKVMVFSKTSLLLKPDAMT